MTSLTRENLKKLADAALKKGTQVIAPAKLKDHAAFKAIRSSAEMLPDTEHVKTRLSLKEFFLPRGECLARFTVGEDGKTAITPAEKPEGARLVLGCRPCDAAALVPLDAVMNWDYIDKSYARRRALTTVVSIACGKTDKTCFCTSVGLSPSATAGSDLLLRLSASGYLAEPVTDKGKAFLKEYKEFFAEESKESPSPDPGLPAQFDPKEVREFLDAGFEDPLWEELGNRCLGCGTCAFVCPTCHCFDIVDEAGPKGGERLRHWDTCAYGLFTRHGSGHNPRPKQSARFRQRVMHKFKYYPEKFQVLSCVGCGRCVAACSTDNSILAALKRMKPTASKV
jgi:formate hydrogenlyase subunit 6/NADH:ubiquinone oxidoreductase subunit I